ncbi:hypothetical protein SLE2022_399540 [Rubroshorea leprosula]
MAASGNPNQAISFDVQKLFKPTGTPNPSLPVTNPHPPPDPSFSTSSSSFPPSSPRFFHPQYQQFYMPPSTTPTAPHNFLVSSQVAKSVSYPSPPLNPFNAGNQILALINSSPQNPEFPHRPHQQLPPPEFMYHGGANVGPFRVPSGKLPRGRRLAGSHVTYDVDVRILGEVKPQLEVTPITKYGSDPQLVLGRQIAVNKSYICYGLKGGNIRILNMNTALRSLLRGHTQRVTDMAFFAEDVHLLASVSSEGCVYVWKITEGPDEVDESRISGKIVIAVQILGDEEYVHPRVCWHKHKQEVLVVAIGKCVLRIDTTKVGKNEVFSSDTAQPLQCSIDKLIDGIQLVGKHYGEVTDLSMCQWMATRLVSASTDGTIKIWEDHKAVPLVVLRPHDGQPVYLASFLTAPHRPDHIILITGGPLNREVKIWASGSEEGWLLPSNADSWTCTQTLDLESSADSRVEEAFFNQALALSQAGLVLLANAKKNAIYAVHLEYGSCPAATHMDYISEFTVTMPILSFTGTSDPPDEHIVKVYCVQIQAIQQYDLELCQCIPPPLENVGLEKSNSSLSHDVTTSEGHTAFNLSGSRSSELLQPDRVPKPCTQVASSENSTVVRCPLPSASTESTGAQEFNTLNIVSKPASLASATSDADIASVAPPPLPPSPSFSMKLSGFHSPRNSFEPASQFSEHVVNQPVTDYSVDRQMDTIQANLCAVSLPDVGSRSNENKKASDDMPSPHNPPIIFKHPTHLVTPSEILMAASSSEANSKTEGESNIHDLVDKSDVTNAEVELKVVGEARSQNDEFGSKGESQNLKTENRERLFCSQASGLGIQMARESCGLSGDSYIVEKSRQIGAGASEPLAQPHVVEEETHDTRKDVTGKQSSAPSTKGKKQKGKISHAAGQSSPSSGVFNSAEVDSSIEPGKSSNLPSTDSAFPQILVMQGMLNQLMTMQKDMQKQMSNIVNLPVTKEGRRLEASLGRSFEKAVKANADALWARFQEENAKNEKLSRDRAQQISNLINNFVNKDLAVMLEKAVKKELAAVGQAVTRALTPAMEKTIASSIAESFQKAVGDKAVNQLEKSVNSKLEATVARQIQAQFQTSGRQALQDALKSGIEVSVIPAFEMSCKAMFEQVDTAFQKGMIEHTNAAQQHLESAHSLLAHVLRDSINSASSITQTLSGELADAQRNLLALVAAGASSNAVSPMVSQISNGPLSGLHEKVEVPLDPTKELSRLASERKYEDAFTIALQRIDLSIVSWLCSQVDLRAILTIVPLPLSQGVLISLLQQLACDVNKETSQKLGWMTEVAAAINPADQMIAMHVRPIFDQVYKILHHLHSSPMITGAEHSSIRLLMHVINSVLLACK